MFNNDTKNVKKSQKKCSFFENIFFLFYYVCNLLIIISIKAHSNTYSNLHTKSMNYNNLTELFCTFGDKPEICFNFG